jgi:type II secretory pathway pseudopilin PulG
MVRSRVRRESGHTLLIALIAVLVLGAALALVAGSLVSRMQRLRVETRATSLLALSDAAVARSLAEMAGRPSAGGFDEMPFGGGTLESEVSHGAAGRFVIVARASFRGTEMRVEVRGVTTDQGPRVTGWRRLPAERDDGGGGFTRPEP